MGLVAVGVALGVPQSLFRLAVGAAGSCSGSSPKPALASSSSSKVAKPHGLPAQTNEAINDPFLASLLLDQCMWELIGS